MALSSERTTVPVSGVQLERVGLWDLFYQHYDSHGHILERNCTTDIEKMFPKNTKYCYDEET